MITLHTNLGDITIALDFENTPITAENFQKYAEAGFYDGTIFHRVIDNFMVQGGGFDRDMNQKETEMQIENEADKAKPNKRGTIAMARTTDPHSASSQFFINVKDNPFLNHTSKTRDGWGYCVFGEVVEGMDVIDEIKQTATGSRRGHSDVPVQSIIIEHVTVAATQAAE